MSLALWRPKNQRLRYIFDVGTTRRVGFCYSFEICIISISQPVDHKSLFTVIGRRTLVQYLYGENRIGGIRFS